MGFLKAFLYDNRKFFAFKVGVFNDIFAVVFINNLKRTVPYYLTVVLLPQQAYFCQFPLDFARNYQIVNLKSEIDSSFRTCSDWFRQCRWNSHSSFLKSGNNTGGFAALFILSDCTTHTVKKKRVAENSETRL